MKEIVCKQLAVMFCNSIYMHRKMDSLQCLRWMAHDPSSPPKLLVTRNWSPETCVQVLHTRHKKLVPETWHVQFRRFTSPVKTLQVQH